MSSSRCIRTRSFASPIGLGAKTHRVVLPWGMAWGRATRTSFTAQQVCNQLRGRLPVSPTLSDPFRQSNPFAGTEYSLSEDGERACLYASDHARITVIAAMMAGSTIYDEENAVLLPSDDEVHTLQVANTGNTAPKHWRGKLMCCFSGCDLPAWGSVGVFYVAPCVLFGYVPVYDWSA